MNIRRRCIFCFRQSGDGVQLSREHLLSRPVAKAFAIDRESPFLLMNGDLTEQRWRSLNGISRKCVCRDCNSGWMRRLEEALPAVANWLTGDPAAPLGDDLDLLTRKWALKTHLVLCFLEGLADKWDDDDFPEAVMPPMTVAKQLFQEDIPAIRDANVGIAKSGAATEFAYAFGHPSMKRTGPKTWNATTAPASIISLGRLQLWVITPFIHADIETLAGVMPVSASVTPGNLVKLRHPTKVDEVVVVDYGADHDAADLARRLAEWATQQSRSERER